MKENPIQKAQELKYFEVKFSNDGTGTEKYDERFICIKAIDTPTVAEAQEFCAKDSEILGLPVTGVFPIDERTARGCYDFSNENTWPIFSKTAATQDDSM